MKNFKLVFLSLLFGLTAAAQGTYITFGATVLDTNGNPVPNHQVVVVDSTSGPFFPGIVSTYTTDANGMFIDSMFTGTAGMLMMLTQDACLNNYFYDTVYTGNQTSINWFTTIVLACAPTSSCNSQFTAQTSGLSVTLNLPFIGGINGSLTVDWGNGQSTVIAAGALPTQASFTYQTAGLYAVCATVVDSLNTCTATYCDSVLIGSSANQNSFLISALVVTNNYQNTVPNHPVLVIDSSSSGAFPVIAVHNYVTDGNGEVHDSIVTAGASGTLWFMAPDSCGFTTIAIAYAPTSPGTLATAGLVLCNNTIGGGSTNCNYTVSALPVAGMPNQAFFTFNGQGGSTYLWDFGDGNTSNQPAPFHTYAQAGTYYYCLQIDSCTPVCDSITVFSQGGGCDPFFFPVVNGNTVDIYPALLTGQFLAVVDWGDGVVDTFTPQNIPTIPNTISHTYNAPGNYQICFTHSNAQLGCSNTHCSTVSVTSVSPLQCNASFIIDTVNSQPGMVYVWNISGVTGASATTTVDFLWNFGDGSTSNQPFPTHQYQSPGTYVLCLTVSAVDSTPAGSFTCSSTYCDTLTVDQNGNIVYKGAILGWTLTVLNPATIGQNELSIDDALLYPNPAHEEISLQIPMLPQTEVSVRITDLSGAVLQTKRVKSGYTSKVNLADLPSGMYIITLEADGRIRQEKIIKYE